MKTVVDTLAGAMIKRWTSGRRDGVAVVAEGLVLKLDPDDLKQLADVERDEHDNVRIAEVNLGDILKTQVAGRLAQFGLKITIVSPRTSATSCAVRIRSRRTWNTPATSDSARPSICWRAATRRSSRSTPGSSCRSRSTG